MHISPAQEFVNDLKEYITSKKDNWFDRVKYEAALKGYVPNVLAYSNKFFDAIQSYIANKDEATLLASTTEYLSHGSYDSSQSYVWASHTDQEGFLDFLAMKRLQAFLTEVTNYSQTGKTLQEIDWQKFSSWGTGQYKQAAEKFYKGVKDYIDGKQISLSDLLQPYKMLNSIDIYNWAAAFGQVDLARFLQENNYKYDQKYDGGVPLDSAARSSDCGVLKLFVEEFKADVNYDDGQMSLLYNASLYGDEKGPDLLLKRGASPEGNLAKDGETPLMGATRNPDIKVATRLLGANANVNAGDWALGGFTPIMYAAMWGSEELMNLLISRGANLTHASQYNKTTPLHATVWNPSSKPAEILLGKQVQVDPIETQYGRTPLNLAVSIGLRSLDTVKAFVGAGANVNTTDKDGRTPLDYAYEVPVMQGHGFTAKDLQDFLISKGAKRSADLQTYVGAAAGRVGAATSYLMSFVYAPKLPVNTNLASTACVHSDTVKKMACCKVLANPHLQRLHDAGKKQAGSLSK